MDLFGRELLAVDSTRLKAVNSRARNFSRERLATYLAASDARLERYLTELDEIDRSEDGAGTVRGEAPATKIARLREQRQASAALLGQMKESGEGQISLTDPDARPMIAHSKVTVGYNAQVAVDAKHSLIVEQHVTNAATDMGLLAVIRKIEVERDAMIKEEKAEAPIAPLAMLRTLKGIGPEFAAVLWSEGLFRQFDNRRQVAAYAGLAPTPWQSGKINHDQGVSEAGNPRLRTTMIQIAWLCGCGTSRPRC